MVKTPLELNFSLPAEWEAKKACWLAWPWDGSLWEENLESAQIEFTTLCKAILPEPIHLLCEKNAQQEAASALDMPGVKFFSGHYGDIWLRDTAPLFLKNPAGQEALVTFGFNGWGEKYVLDGDDTVAKQIAETFSIPVFQADFILEGGSVETNGRGLCLTTKQCLLNKNRNPDLTKSEVEKSLLNWLGQNKILWLNDGLLNDHTDGHIDNIARFADESTVVCMRSESDTDPNKKVLEEIEATLRSFQDQNGKPLNVVTIPSVGYVPNDEGHARPASYLNFYIANQSVVVPLYGTEFDAKALERLRPLFPGRKVVGVSANSILTGGGSFHCITQPYFRGENFRGEK